MTEKLFVVSPYFNPRGYKSRKRLFKEFQHYIHHCGAELIAVEVAFNGRPFEVTDDCNPYHLQLHTRQEMWHKERLINLGIQHLLKLHHHVKKVAWIDADVKFSNVNWVNDTLQALDHYDVIQLFSQNQNLGPNHENLQMGGSVFYNFVNKIFANNKIGTFKPYIAMGHPGLAWAATVDALNSLGGLMDFCIHGSGDSHMANALMGDVRSYYQTRLPSVGLLAALDAWAERADRHIKGNVGFIPGICYHYWHGKMNQRGYKERWDIICDHNFDPYTDIYIGANGLHRWTGNKKQFEYDLRAAMIARNEDSVDL